jgi:hypothetical protein
MARRWCRLAVLFRCRVSEIARWPAWELDLVEHYLAIQPAPEERIEIAVASLHHSFATVRRRKGSPEPKLDQFLPYMNPWQRFLDSRRYTPLDREILAAFGR